MKKVIKVRTKNSKYKFKNNGETINQIVSIGTLVLAFATFLLSVYNTYVNMVASDPLYIRSIYSSDSSEGEIVLDDIVYSIDSTLEYNRYTIKDFVPILYVYIEDNNEIIYERFLELPHLYSTKNIQSETSIFSFCDFKIHESSYDYFCRLVSTQYNRKGCNKNMNSKIVYFFKADYADINNKRKSKEFIISRYSNSINPFEEFKLYFDDVLLKSFQESKQNNTVEYSKTLHELEKIYYESEISCLRNSSEELIKGINGDVISFIESIQQEYGLDLAAKRYDDLSTLS